MRKTLLGALVLALASFTPALGAPAPRSVSTGFTLAYHPGSHLFALECEAYGRGQGIKTTSITLCRITFADGASYHAYPVTAPGYLAVTATAFRHAFMPYTLCLSGTARYLDGSSKTSSRCVTS